MMPHERRLSIRKPLEHLVYLSLPSNNGGVVLDVSEGGVGFHAIAPVEADGLIDCRFSIDSAARISAVGELAWKDETGKVGGLRFTQLPNEVREQIRVWAGQSNSTANSTANSRAKASVLDIPIAEPAIEAEVAASSSAAVLGPVADISVAEPAIEAKAAPTSDTELAPGVAAENPLLFDLKPPDCSALFNKLAMFPLEPDFEAGATAAVVPQLVQMLDGIAEQIRICVAQSKASVHDNPFADPAFETEIAPGSETELAPVVGLPMAEPVIECEAAPSSTAELAPLEAAGNPLPPYNQKPPINSAPFHGLSMFPLEQNSEAGATAVGVPQRVGIRHPIAAVVVTIALAFVVSIGIFAYVFTSQAGDLIYDWGEKMWGGSYSQSIQRDPMPPAGSAPNSSKLLPQ
jgi:hypothetical protein